MMPWETDSILERVVKVRRGDSSFQEECTANLHRYSPPYIALTYQDHPGGPVQTRPVVSHGGPFAPSGDRGAGSLSLNMDADVFTNFRVLAQLVQEIDLGSDPKAVAAML